MAERENKLQQRVADAIITAELIKNTLASPMHTLPPPPAPQLGRVQEAQTVQIVNQAPDRVEDLVGQAADAVEAENERKRDAIRSADQLKDRIVEDPLARQRQEDQRKTTSRPRHR